MPTRNAVSWNSLINSCRSPPQAFCFLNQMHSSGFVPKPELIATVLSGCARTGESRLGAQIHALALTHPDIRHDSPFLSTALLDFYFRCRRSPSLALHLFNAMPCRNQVSWTAMISGCVACLHYDVALHCLRAMQTQGLTPNRVTVLAVLPACARPGCVLLGKELHGYALRRRLHSDPRCSAALMHMYCKCEKASSRSARVIFERSGNRDVVMWSSMIKHSSGGKAVELFNKMQAEGTKPNSVTFLALISASTSLSLLDLGSQVHARAFKSGLNNQDIFVGNALINMYAKCGCIRGARQIFAEMEIKDSVSWSTLIGSYGLHGRGEEALKLFDHMRSVGLEVDGITFLAVLSACSRAGMLEAGRSIFQHLIQCGNEIPLTIEHYASYVDLLGRSGKLDYACEVVATMPLEPSPTIWTSLMSSCKLHGRLDIAESLAQRLIESDPKNAANYTLLSMVYAESGNWRGVEEMRRAMQLQRLNKCYGFSRLQLKNKTL